MKVVILAGGQKSTISSEQVGIPKPMVEIGGKPMLWHIMKSFSAHGLNEFVICGGYKVDMIKEYFMDFYIYQSDITVDLQTNTIQVHKNRTEDWRVTVVDTGVQASTGQRVSQIKEYVDDDTFIVTYGDCLSDVNVKEMIEYHKKHDKQATMAVAKPTGRNEALEIDADGKLIEKHSGQRDNQVWTNACLYVLEPSVFDILKGNYNLEKMLAAGLTGQGELITYKHHGFWAPVETYRDRVNMEELWNAGVAPWAK